MTELTTYDADRLTVAIVGDLHVGSTVGLCAPKVHLDDGGWYVLSQLQSKLWNCWLDYWAHVKQAAADYPLIVVLNGDLMDGDHHRTTQIISANPEVQVRACMDVLKPMLDLHPEMVFVVRGTEAHAGQSAHTEETIARELGAVKACAGQYSHYILRAMFGGVRFDIAHHGKLGRLPWTRSNALNTLAVKMMLSYPASELPAFALRSHNHQFAESGTNYPVRVISLPCWQGPTSYVQALEPGALPDIGGLIFTIEKSVPAWELKGYSKGVDWMNS